MQGTDSCHCTKRGAHQHMLWAIAFAAGTKCPHPCKNEQTSCPKRKQLQNIVFNDRLFIGFSLRRLPFWMGSPVGGKSLLDLYVPSLYVCAANLTLIPTWNKNKKTSQHRSPWNLVDLGLKFSHKFWPGEMLSRHPLGFRIKYFDNVCQQSCTPQSNSR